MTDSNKLIKSLVGYVKGVKPYHSKLREFTSELFFDDSINVAAIDQQPELRVTFQNVWDRISDERLARLSEGASFDQIIDIPATVLSRFSLNTFLNYSQSPLGHDPASPDLTNQDIDGKPDSEVPYVLPIDPQGLNHLSQSRRLGSDTIPIPVQVDYPEFVITSATLAGDVLSATGTAHVVLPAGTITQLTAFGADFGQIKIHMNWKMGDGLIMPATVGTITELTGTYDIFEFEITSFQLDITGFPLPSGTVAGVTNEQWALALLHMAEITAQIEGDTGRYKVPFHHGIYIEVDNIPQTLVTDFTVNRHRSAIQFLAGKHPTTPQRLSFNFYTSDRMFVAMAAPFTFGSAADSFAISIDSSYSSGYQPIAFVDVQPSSPKCTIKNLQVLGSVNGDQWILTAISEYVLSVQQIAPTVGPIEFAYLNREFDNGQLSFTISAPWVEYYFDLQTGGYLAAVDIPTGDYAAYEWLYDRADFFPSADIRTQHGIPNDPIPPLHEPVLYNQIGHVKQRLDGSYYLQLSSIPPRGTYIEVRIEQGQQYNPRAATAMGERLDIVVFTDSDISFSGGYDSRPFDAGGTDGYDDIRLLNGQDDSNGKGVVTMITTYTAPALPPLPIPTITGIIDNFAAPALPPLPIPTITGIIDNFAGISPAPPPN